MKDDPMSIAAANTLAKAFLSESEMKPPNSMTLETILPVLQQQKQCPDSVSLTLMLAHAQNADRRHAESLQTYFQAFCSISESKVWNIKSGLLVKISH